MRHLFRIPVFLCVFVLAACPSASYLDQIATMQITMTNLNNAGYGYVTLPDCEAPGANPNLCSTDERRVQIKEASKTAGDALRGAQADAEDPAMSEDDVRLAISTAQRAVTAFESLLRTFNVSIEESMTYPEPSLEMGV